MQKQLLLVYHTATQSCFQLAQAIQTGAQREATCSTQCLLASATHPHHVIAADAVIIITPEMLGSMAGMMKDFFDRCYYPLLASTQGKPYALVVSAGSDGQGCVRQIERIATGLRWRAMQPAKIICTQAQTAETILATKIIPNHTLTECRAWGELFATGLVQGIF